jgi:hypothetical protein
VNYSYFGDLLDYREYTLNVHAIKGLTPRVQPTGPLVVPGTYRIELKVDGETHTREVTIVNDPRVLVTQAGLEAQLQLEQQMMAGLSVSYSEFASIQRLRAAVVAAQARADTLPSQAQTVTALKTLDAHAAALADSGFGPANRDLTRHLEDMEFGDLDPTASTVAATEADCRAIDGALAKLRQLEATEVAAVNGILAGGALPVESPSAAPACGATPGAGTRP